MYLVDAKIRGIKRLGGGTPHKLLLDAPLVCLIGANEAGKSTVLQALEATNSTAPIAVGDRSRLEVVPDDQVVVELQYRLEERDIDDVREWYPPADGRVPRRFTVSKHAGGAIDANVDVPARRDRSGRVDMRASLLQTGVKERLTEQPLDAEGEPVGEAALTNPEFDDLCDALSEDVDSLSPAAIASFESAAESLRGAGEGQLADALADLGAEEGAPHPTARVSDILLGVRPRFVRFAGAERDLASEYDLAEEADNPPPALANLARLADLDLDELLRLIEAEETGTVVYRQREANRTLESVFSAWSQEPPIHVTLDLSGTLLRVHVTTGEHVPMKLSERSDGLREFVALVAATGQPGAASAPILLIDEVETHLHYDAQVDLVGVLSRQTQAHGGPIGQVVYTTHSAACLPEDLASVRVVQGHESETRSGIRNQFWTDTPGLGPLLMAMGAASLAFVPRRAALVTEGASDLILLPTLLAQATGRTHLGYQVAPGASNARPGALIGLDLQAPKTAWLVDGDSGGAAVADKLIADGIDPKSVIHLGGRESGLILEDLVDVTAYRDAIGAYMADKGLHSDPPDEKDLVDNRPATVERFFGTLDTNPPSKVVIANRLVAMRSERNLPSSEHRELLRDLDRSIRQIVDARTTA